MFETWFLFPLALWLFGVLCNWLLRMWLLSYILSGILCTKGVISNLLSVDYVVCLRHVLLLISMHCGLLEGEFSEFSCSESNLLLLFILLLVFAMLCCLFECTVDNHIASEWSKFQFEVKLACHIDFVDWLCHALFFFCFAALWITSLWVQWTFIPKIKPACPVDFAIHLSHALCLF